MDQPIEQEIQLSPVEVREKFIKDFIRDFHNGAIVLSYTALSKFKKSPRSFIDYKINPYEQTDAQELGTLVHCLVLEPTKFDERYVVDDQICAEIGGAKPRATNVYREWKQKQINKKVISNDDYLLAKSMSDAVLNNLASKKIIDQCTNFEFKISFTHNTLKFHGYIDGIGDVIFDLKICTDADPKKFQREIINHGYYLQPGVYMTGIEELKPYYIIAVDRNLGVSVHLIEQSFVEYAMNEFDKLTQEFKNCCETQSFNQSYEYRSNNREGYHVMARPAYLP